MKKLTGTALSLIALLLSVSAFAANARANKTQAEYMTIGNLFGMAEGILETHYRINGNTPLGASYVTFIDTSLKSAADAIGSTDEMATLFGESSPSIAGILRRINMYERTTRNYSIQQKAAYIRETALTYRGTLMKTMMSDREDVVQSRPNCDSSYFAVGYHLGRAEIAATVSATDRRKGNIDTYQRDAFGGMINAIGDGLRLSVTGYPEGRLSDNTEKVCCSFGTVSAWDSFKDSLRWNSSSEQMMSAFKKRYREVTVEEIDTGACGSDDEIPWEDGEMSGDILDEGLGDTAGVGEYGSMLGRWRYFNPFHQKEENCILNFTDIKGAYGFVVEGCGRSESFWKVEGGRLKILSDRGTLTGSYFISHNNQQFDEGGTLKVFNDKPALIPAHRGVKLP